MNTRCAPWGFEPPPELIAESSDAEWFAANPDRSHRSREAIPGEYGEQSFTLPEGFRLVTFVRQFAPGERLRLGFGLNVALLVDQSEAFAAAMFEIAEAGQDVSAEEMLLAMRRHTMISEVRQ